ncbi:response regulator transcription factor [Actinoplanes regularis]|uniref:response regulator transcription factor n=1 Tax=Actinoplanes regularis TaxID=52697 RepID=UPI0024A4FD23|nr:response regulator [Actinoplanes regularis]GLW33215.1 hypothetical protein Areg01_61530 [Actinoplanes regularis]
MARILVVDDDPVSRQSLTDVLESAGYEVSTAADGPAAVHAVQAAGPDFVVLEVMMAGLDGFGVLDKIRGRTGEPIPVLMTTASAEPESVTRAWASGVDYHLTRPFTAGTVLDLIDGVLGRVGGAAYL